MMDWNGDNYNILYTLHKLFDVTKTIRPERYLIEITNCDMAILDIILKCQKAEKCEKIKMTHIAKMLDVSLPNISRSVRRLEEKNIVIRNTDLVDRRKTYVEITKHGMEIFEMNKGRVDEYMNRVSARFSQEEKMEFSKIIGKLTFAIKEELEKTEGEH